MKDFIAFCIFILIGIAIGFIWCFAIINQEPTALDVYLGKREVMIDMLKMFEQLEG